jgi:hypothetical protein
MYHTKINSSVPEGTHRDSLWVFNSVNYTQVIMPNFSLKGFKKSAQGRAMQRQLGSAALGIN